MAEMAEIVSSSVSRSRSNENQCHTVWAPADKSARTTFTSYFHILHSHPTFTSYFHFHIHILHPFESLDNVPDHWWKWSLCTHEKVDNRRATIHFSIFPLARGKLASVFFAHFLDGGNFAREEKH